MSSEHTKQSGYMSYLVRLRRVPGAEGHIWQASLEEPLTQKIHHFKGLAGLFAFLLDVTGESELPQRKRYRGVDGPTGTG